MNLKLIIQCENESTICELDDQLEKIENLTYKKASQSGFDGLQLFMYFLFIGSGGVACIAALKEIIIKLISRNDIKSVKIGQTELKGYSERDVVKIVEQLYKNSIDLSNGNSKK